ncbi:MAG: hypothetical protein AB7I27_15120 [Bacteriovoracaceae bacterium]
MALRVSYLIILTVLSMTFSFASTVQLNEVESPYVILERAFNSAKRLESEQIPTITETATKLKTLKMLDVTIDVDTTLYQIQSSVTAYLVKRSIKTVSPATPSRGPLFPGKPETTEVREEIINCMNDCVSENDFPEWGGIFLADENDNYIKWPLQIYTVRSLGDAVIFRAIRKNQTFYRYGWLE